MTPISAPTYPPPGCLGERDGDGKAWEETNDGEEAAASVEIARAPRALSQALRKTLSLPTARHPVGGRNAAVLLT
ncbi:unnamed protein product [Arctogadus glacialis]